jgi:hypothetical protein
MITVWTVPSRLSSFLQQYPALFPDRVHKYLEANGVVVEGVSVIYRMRIETPDGWQYVEGPFLRVSSDVDPTALLDASPTPDPPTPKADVGGPLNVLNLYLDKVNSGGTVSQADILACTTAMARIVRVLVNERTG